MSNPFVPAQWGETYKLGEAEWRPEGKLIATAGAREIAISGNEIFWLDHKSKPPFGDKETLTQYRERVKVLLPSPDFINAQADPRAAAIAALERAGGRVIPGGVEFEFRNEAADGAILTVNTDPGEPYVCEFRTDSTIWQPEFSRALADYHTTLHQWAAAITWDAEDAHHD